MATSIQVSVGRAEAFNDIDLLVLVHLMLQAASRMGQTPATAEIVARLRTVCEGYGPGTKDLQLDDIRKNEVPRSAYLDILRMTTDRLDSAGPTVPARAIMTGWLARGVRIDDFSADLIRAVRDFGDRNVNSRIGAQWVAEKLNAPLRRRGRRLGPCWVARALPSKLAKLWQSP